MSILNALEARRTYYKINKMLPINIDEIVEMAERATALVPDAFNMKSSRLVIVTGDKHDLLWETIYKVFDGKVDREKIDGFKRGSGTILYFYDQKVVDSLTEQYPAYKDNFPVWANQASAMLQLSVWTALREKNIGASLQHFNPVIDDAVRELLDLPKEFVLVAQMPFGGIIQEPGDKPKENAGQRVLIVK